MDADYQKGQRLFVETQNETVEGVFHSMDANRTKLTLKNCVLQPSGKALNAMNFYYRNEILCIKALDPVSQPVEVKDREPSGDWNLMHKSQNVSHHDKLPGSVTKGDVVMNKIPGQNIKPRAGRKPRMSENEYDEATKLIRNSVLIERKGRFFMEAVESIRAEHCVAVSFEGATLGRNNPMSLMCISTPQRAFVFDIQAMGKSAYEKDLKHILESDKIEKVIHNCRFVSDCLYHKHGVLLNRVFDTQVADLIVTKKVQGDYPQDVKSLSQCLSLYLNLPKNLIYHPEIRDGYVGTDLGKWRQRPLPCELQMAIVKNTVFLLNLKERLLTKMLHPFLCGVDIFLNVVKNKDQEGAHDQQARAAVVPKEFLKLAEESDDGQKMMVTRNGLTSLNL